MYTDMYEISMAQGYFYTGKAKETAVFDYFFRSNPFDGGYVVFAGLGDLLEVLSGFRFDREALEYLKEQGFRKEFLDHLSDFRFRGDVYSVREGELVFPDQPVLMVKGNIIETQLAETLVLNYLNFQSLIATKASRMRQVAGEKLLLDFGLRRAQGLGGYHASKAAVIGGFDSTSNVLSGLRFGVNISGTQAHSWVQSFEDELEAFRKFTEVSPELSVLLVDTYDTLKSGIPNAIKVGLEMKKKGLEMKGIRLDSGDLAYFSKKARAMLDEAGLKYVKIFASNQLDERVIRSLELQKAPIDGFGVGTKLITGKDSAALDGVYKLAMHGNHPSLKISENIEKLTLPGEKKILRLADDHGYFMADAICLHDEDHVEKIIHRIHHDKQMTLSGLNKEAIQQKVMEQGEITGKLFSARESAAYKKERLSLLPEEHLRFESPHVYKVGVSEKLLKLQKRIVGEIKEKF